VARLVPVDGNPFEQPAQGPRLVPVEGNPFEQPAPPPSITERVAGWWNGDATEKAGTVMESPEFRRQARDQLLSNPSLGGVADILKLQFAGQMFGNDEDIANAAARLVPGSQVTTDEAGNAMVQTPDGGRFYANTPGADFSDARRFGSQVAAYVPAARAASAIGGASLAGRSALTGLFSGATNAGTQVAAGRDKIDPVEVGITTVAGAAAEPLVQGAVTLGRNAARLLPSAAVSDDAARQLAMRAGVSDPSPEQLRALAGAADELRAGADPRTILGREQFGFQYRLGQRLPESDPRRLAQVSREEVLRQDPISGPILRNVEQRNVAALGDAVEGIASTFGGRGATPAQNAANAAGRISQQADELRGRISAAYQRATELNRAAISRDSVAQVPQRMRAALREFDVNAATTPGAARTLEQIQNASRLVASAPDGVKGVTMRALEAQRRIILNAQGTATNPTDRAALGVIKREFDSWMDDAVENALVSGDAQALTAIKEARGLRAEFGRRFQGGEEADRFIEGLLDGSRTPEELLNVALGAGQVSKASAARFVDRLRLAANNDPEVMGSLKSAHFERLVRGADGELLDMGRIVRNVKSMEYSNESIIRALYSPQEWAQVRTLASSLEPMVARGDLARSSGTAERMMRSLFQFMRGGPVVGSVIDGATAGRRTMQAMRAVDGAVTPVPRAMPNATALMSAVLREPVTD
jgi:hypothetical protein